MKKILFGTAGAICMAMGLSSYRLASSSSNIYWFPLKTSFAKNQTLPAVKNTDLNGGFLSETATGTNPGVPGVCSTGSHYCLVGFGSTQLTSSNHEIIITSGAGTIAEGGPLYTKS